VKGKYEEALTNLNTAIQSNDHLGIKETLTRNVIGDNSSCFGKVANQMIVLYTNLASVQLMRDNIDTAQKALEKAVSLAQAEKGEDFAIPVPILNIMIYIELK
jgi:hypothetical protein